MTYVLFLGFIITYLIVTKMLNSSTIFKKLYVLKINAFISDVYLF